MSNSYGQLGMTLDQYNKQVQLQLKKMGIPFNAAIAKKLWKKGYTVSDAVSFFITHP